MAEEEGISSRGGKIARKWGKIREGQNFKGSVRATGKVEKRKMRKKKKEERER